MADTSINNEMKRHAVIVSIKAKHSNLEIARFLKVARSFVCKVRKELNENNGDELATSKRKQHCQRSDSLRTPEFVRRVHGMIDENLGKSMRHLAKDLQVSEGTIRNVVHQDLGYKSYVLRRGQFMSTKTQENRLMRAKRLLHKLKHPEEQECLWFFSDEKTSTRIKKSTQEMIGGYVRTPLKFQLLCARSFQQQWWFSVLLAVKGTSCLLIFSTGP